MTSVSGVLGQKLGYDKSVVIFTFSISCIMDLTLLENNRWFISFHKTQIQQSQVMCKNERWELCPLEEYFFFWIAKFILVERVQGALRLAVTGEKVQRRCRKYTEHKNTPKKNPDKI